MRMWTALWLLAGGCSTTPGDYDAACEDVSEAVDDQVACLDDAAAMARADVEVETERLRGDCDDATCERDAGDAGAEASRQIDEDRERAQQDLRDERDPGARLRRLRRALRRLQERVDELRERIRRLRQRHRRHRRRECRDDTGCVHDTGRTRDTGRRRDRDTGRTRDTGRRHP